MENRIKYELILYWSEEDESYIVEVPELPGCKADGSTYEEAIEQVQIIIKEWLEIAEQEGRSIPRPKGKIIYV